MQITIEFTAVGRLLAGVRQVILTVPAGTTYRVLIGELAHRYPALVGVIIQPSGEAFLSATLFSRNGNEMILPGMEDQTPTDGDHLIVVSVITGGHQP
jgi:hypothetical protein